jgi:hypothetical protein
MMDAVTTSEPSVNLYETTRCNIPDDGNLHTLHRKNFKFRLGSSNCIFNIVSKYSGPQFKSIEYKLNPTDKHNVIKFLNITNNYM